jgi:hypothetical protein
VYIVQAEPESNINTIFNIKYLGNQAIKWEKLKKDGISQCTKCQRFGHSSANCNMLPRCVKCGKEHLAKECNIQINSPREELFCILCKEKGHPASYRQCPKYQEAIENAKARKENKVRRQINTIIPSKILCNSLKSNLSFANVVKNNLNNNQNSINNTIEMPIQIWKNKFKALHKC